MRISFEILKEEFDRTWWKERKRGKGREGKEGGKEGYEGEKSGSGGGGLLISLYLSRAYWVASNTPSHLYTPILSIFSPLKRFLRLN